MEGNLALTRASGAAEHIPRATVLASKSVHCFASNVARALTKVDLGNEGGTASVSLSSLLGASVCLLVGVLTTHKQLTSVCKVRDTSVR
jgi:hypothetical protein